VRCSHPSSSRAATYAFRAQNSKSIRGQSSRKGVNDTHSGPHSGKGTPPLARARLFMRSSSRKPMVFIPRATAKMTPPGKPPHSDMPEGPYRTTEHLPGGSMQCRGPQRCQNGLRGPRCGEALADCGGSPGLLEYPVTWVFILPNAETRSRGASDIQNLIDASTPRRAK